MNYNFKRALGISFALYIVTFIIGLGTAILTGEDMSSTENISDIFWYIGLAASVVFTALSTMWYLRGASLVASMKSGLYFGLSAIAFSFVLDIIFFAMGNSQGAGVDILGYYGDYRFWLVLALVLATAAGIGKWRTPKVQLPPPSQASIPTPTQT